MCISSSSLSHCPILQSINLLVYHIVPSFLRSIISEYIKNGINLAIVIVGEFLNFLLGELLVKGLFLLLQFDPHLLSPFPLLLLHDLFFGL